MNYSLVDTFLGVRTRPAMKCFSSAGDADKTVDGFDKTVDRI